MPIKVLITSDVLKLICPRLNLLRINNLVAHINTICPQYGIDTADIFHEFLANLCEESGEFSRYEENLNYSAESLIKNFGRHRISEADAYRFGRTGQQQANQKAIANLIYGGIWGSKNLGNKKNGDGFLFRGSGPIQITGRGNVTAFATWMETKMLIKKTPEEWTELLRTSDLYGIHSACWLFAIAKKLIDEAEQDQMKEIVIRINGCLTNYPKRLQYYELAKKLIA